MTTTNTPNKVTALDADHVTPATRARVERKPGGGMPAYDVLIGDEHAGVMWDEQGFDEASLPHGRYVAWSGKTGNLGFFASIEAAADAIAETWPAPAAEVRQDDDLAEWTA